MRKCIVIFLVVLTCNCLADTPPASSIVGKIKRDENGKLVLVPDPAPVIASDQSPQNTAVTAVPSPQGDEVLPRQKTATPSKNIAALPIAAPKTLRVGPGRSISTIAGASVLAKNGDTVEIDAGEYRGDVAVWTQDRLTIRGVGGSVRLIASGANAEGKAIWVIRGGNVEVENIAFSDTRVPDRNGAGIRFEKGTLTIRNCKFLHNENGILTSAEPNSELIVENSEFGYNGAGDGRSHNIYVGEIKRFVMTGSYSHHAKVGHLLKTRAAENNISYNRLTDESGGRASYEIDIPNGGHSYVVGNIIEQSATTENSNMVTFGIEGFGQSGSELYFVHNTVLNSRPNGGNLFLLGNGEARVVSANNILIGKYFDPNEKSIVGYAKDLAKRIRGTPVTQVNNAAIESTNQIRADSSAFFSVENYDFRPLKNSGLENKVSQLGGIASVGLVPVKEYVHPASTKSISGRLIFPGAIQSRSDK